MRAVHGNDRAVEGVRVSTPEGEYDLAGRAIIVCSGGFQANAEMRARYLGPNADLMKVRGSQAQYRRGAAHAAGARREICRPLAGRAHVADRRQGARRRDSGNGRTAAATR